MHGRPVRVLIVDDYAAARKLFARGLAGHGMQASEAADADEALAVAAATKPDVIILDLFLAGSSGLEVARALRNHPLLAPTGMIALSGHVSEAYQERAAAAGCDLFLAKPCHTEQLVAAIEYVLAARALQIVAEA